MHFRFSEYRLKSYVSELNTVPFILNYIVIPYYNTEPVLIEYIILLF